MGLGKALTVSLGGLVLYLAYVDIMSVTRPVTVKVNNFDQVKYGRYTIHRVITNIGPLRLPYKNDWGRHDNHITLRAALSVGCQYQILISHEPKDREFSVGNYRFIWRGHRSLDLGRIDKVIRALECV